MPDRRGFLKVAGAMTAASSTEALAATVDVTKEGLSPSNTSQPAPPVSLISPPEPRLEAFTEDRLGGKAASGLLGQTHPRTFRESMASIAKALRAAAHADDPIHEWFGTFAASLDTHTVMAVTQGGVAIKNASETGVQRFPFEPQLFESLLGSASTLLDRCLTLRKELGSCETGGFSIAKSYLSFLTAVPIQRNYILNSNSAAIAEVERDKVDPLVKTLSPLI